MIDQGKIIIIVAPSGSGKSTLIKRLRAEFPKLKESVSYTTRPKRVGDVHGVNYFFISEEEFLQKKEAGDFLEWATVHSNYYGTTRQFVEQQVEQGSDLLFDLDIQGTDALKKHLGERAQAIFIAPPSIEELKHRLQTRGTDSQEVIGLRLKNAEKELLRKNDYDYCVKNDDLDRALTELRGIVCEILQG